MTVRAHGSFDDTTSFSKSTLEFLVEESEEAMIFGPDEDAEEGRSPISEAS